MNVLIVGASRGLGLEFVRQYRDQGARVTASARSDAGLAAIEAQGATALRLDVAAADAAAAWPIGGQSFDVVLFCAGVYGPRTQGLEPPTQRVFDDVMHANELGAMRLLPQVQEVLAPGARLALISSRMGSIGLRESAAGWLYRASKAALNSVLRDAALVLAGRALCVSLHPGWVRTDMGGAGADLDVQNSVSGMRRLLERLTPEDHGGFFDHEGRPLAW